MDDLLKDAEVINVGPSPDEAMAAGIRRATDDCFKALMPYMRDAVSESESHKDSTYPGVVLYPVSIAGAEPLPVVIHNEHSFTQVKNHLDHVMIDFTQTVIEGWDLIIDDEYLLKNIEGGFNVIASAMAGVFVFGKAMLVPQPGKLGNTDE